MKHLNPYIAGNPVYGQDTFIGRENVLGFVSRTLHNSSNAIVLFGQRRMGKTSILLHSAHTLHKSGEYTPIYIDLQNRACLPLSNVLFYIAQKIAQAVNLQLPEYTQFDLRGRFFRDVFIPAVLDTLENKGLVLLFDECDVVDQPVQQPASLTFFPYLQDWMAIVKGIRFIFALKRHPTEISTETLGTLKSVRSCKVSLMTDTECEQIVRQSERNRSIHWEPEAVERVWYWTQGHPYFTQLLCCEVWVNAYAEHESDDSALVPSIKAADVDAAINETLAQGGHAFQWLWNGLSLAEQIVMAAMAETAHDCISRKEFMEVLDSSDVRSILREVKLGPEMLVWWDLLRVTGDDFRFAVPLLRHWVAARKPLSRIKGILEANLELLAESLYRNGQAYRIENLHEAEWLLQHVLNLNLYHLHVPRG